MHSPSEFSGRQRFRLRLGALFRIQAGIAVLLTVAIVIRHLPHDWRGRTVPLLEFILVTSLLSWITYAISRYVVSRFTSPLLALLLSGLTGSAFTRPKIDNPAELAVLGMCVALAWILAAGWIDVRDDATPPAAQTPCAARGRAEHSPRRHQRTAL